MLTTSRGTLTTGRGGASSTAPSSDGTVTFHFTARQAEARGLGIYRLSLEPAPTAILQVDYDGLLLYEGRSPGFTWNNASALDLALPGAMYTDDAGIHIRASS